MKKLYFAIAVIATFLFTGCIPPKQTTVYQPPQNYEPVKKTSKYVLTSPFGHKLQVEIEYATTKTGYINNGCQAQYIITNIGNKNYISNQSFIRGKRVVDGFKFDSTYSSAKLVFEFLTSDNKLIEKDESLYDDILIGKTSQARRVSITAGDRECTAVKPIRIEYEGQ